MCWCKSTFFTGIKDSSLVKVYFAILEEDISLIHVLIAMILSIFTNTFWAISHNNN